LPLATAKHFLMLGSGRAKGHRSSLTQVIENFDGLLGKGKAKK